MSRVSSTRGRPPPPLGAPGIAPARACAFVVIRRVFERGAYADRAFAAEATAAKLAPRDRALAMQLAYGVVQRRLTLDTSPSSLRAGRS
jgi:16S rRNA (cytosine967-C5)-methyltransferase